MKYYIISGEASGDLHGSNLVKELKLLDTKAQFRVWGGDLMKEEGATLVKHYRELAFMGFAEVIKNIGTILKNIKFCIEDIQQYQPDVVILIDYPGFNLRIAKKLKAINNTKIFYYISPQVWAWKKSRVHTIKKVIDKMFVILPFEKEFYAQYGYEVEFVGHPLLDAMKNLPPVSREEFLRQQNIASEKPVIALLPGSRKQEIAKMLPLMLSVVEKFPGYRFIVAGAPSVPASFYQEFIVDKEMNVVFGNTYNLLRISNAALVTSGTATLETALLKVPEVVCYKGSWASFQIAKRLVDVKFISLVNLIMDKQVVKELIQEELNTENLVNELARLLNDSEYRDMVIHDFELLQKKLGDAGASRNTAIGMLKTLESLS
ncbi:MAG: lipid-A-disaccharide synthase [Bacteroidota bacterium]